LSVITNRLQPVLLSSQMGVSTHFIGDVSHANGETRSKQSHDNE
jgi:hypothetical protein